MIVPGNAFRFVDSVGCTMRWDFFLPRRKFLVCSADGKWTGASGVLAEVVVGRRGRGGSLALVGFAQSALRPQRIWLAGSGPFPTGHVRLRSAWILWDARCGGIFFTAEEVFGMQC